MKRLFPILSAVLLSTIASAQTATLSQAGSTSLNNEQPRTAQSAPYNEGAEVMFRTPLPSLNYDGAKNGSYNNEEAGIPGVFSSQDTRLGEMIHKLRNSIWDDRRLVFIDGRMIMCSKNWIRDHVHEMKAYKHWEYDLRSFLDFIIDNQREDGSYYELIKQYDDYHWTFVDEPCYRIFPDDNLAAVRLEIESDIEYIVVEGAMQYYRATGDKQWLTKVLPALEKGIDYVTSDPKRWDQDRGLVKRGYTIDTWDFLNTPDYATNRRLGPETPTSIMHGDNSGVYQAMMQLAWMCGCTGQEKSSDDWRRRAETLRENMFRELWNGHYFVHQLPVNCPPIDDFEATRLSLSNTYDINRGVTSLEQSRSIIAEYMKRRDTTSAFAEWFSIDPPYKLFGGYLPGKYVNGGISPFTAGELAKAAFCNGYEAYGWDIIERMMKMVEHDGAIYFLYSPKERKPMGGGPSAWGAAAFINAIDEGLAGIVDTGDRYSSIAFSPRFPVSAYQELRYTTGYEVSGVLVDLRYILAENGLRYRLCSPAKSIDAHIYIPAGRTVDHVRCNGIRINYKQVLVADSRYLDFNLDHLDGIADIEIVFK